jgi:ketosteroid isomerase-like protein
MAAQRKLAADTNGEVREMIDEWAIAVRAKDIESVISHYLSDVVAFDVVDPLEYKGTDMLRQRLTDWFSSFEGPFGFEITNLEVEAGDYLAFCHSLNRVIGIKTDGVQVNMCWRATLCSRKVEGRWKITHSHTSVPFAPETGLASLDLEP